MPSGREVYYKLLLVFAGAYLLGITVTHILPEIYTHQHGSFSVAGICVLGGFFLQQVLEFFTRGIEHGHVYDEYTVAYESEHRAGHRHDSFNSMSAFMLLAALCMHAFLEGGMLAEPLGDGPMYDRQAVLAGIVLHRMPAAFALMTVLVYQVGRGFRTFLYLLLFAVASPLGLLLSNVLVGNGAVGEMGLQYLYAVVCGNFLGIATTITFESSPEHQFHGRKLLAALAGALVAVGVEIFS